MAEVGDGRLDLGIGRRVGRRLTHIFGGECETVRRDLPNKRLWSGNDVVHAYLYGALLVCARGGVRQLTCP